MVAPQPAELVRVSLHPPRDGVGWLSIAPATSGVTLVVINCKGSDGGQLKRNNGGEKFSDVFGHAMRAFHAEVAIGPQTAVVFLVSESNGAGTLSHLIPERQGLNVSSPGGKGGGAAVAWGSWQLGRASPDLDCSPPQSMYGLDPAQCSTRHNELRSHFAVAELQLPLPPEGSPVASGGAPGACLFLSYHGPYKDIGGGRMSKNDKVGWARDLFELAWALATRAGAPIAVGGDFNLSAADLEEATPPGTWRKLAAVPSGAVFEEVKYVPSPRRARKKKIDWLFLLSPRGCTRRLELLPCTAARVLDPAEPHRRGPPEAEVHAEFFDHDAIIVGLALAVRWDMVQAQAAVRIQAAARGLVARQGAKAPATPPQGRFDLKFRVVWEHPALTWDLALTWS